MKKAQCLAVVGWVKSKLDRVSMNQSLTAMMAKQKVVTILGEVRLDRMVPYMECATDVLSKKDVPCPYRILFHWRSLLSVHETNGISVRRLPHSVKPTYLNQFQRKGNCKGKMWQ